MLRWLKRAIVNYGMKNFGSPDDLDGRMHVTPFSPYLYIATYLGAICVMVFPDSHLRELMGYPLYIAWCSTVMLCVPMIFIGRAWAKAPRLPLRYVAIWLRLGGGTGMFFAYLAAVVAQFFHIENDTDDLLFLNTFVMVAVVIFTGQLVARDFWVMFLTESIANRIEREWREPDGN